MVRVQRNRIDRLLEEKASIKQIQKVSEELDLLIEEYLEVAEKAESTV